MTGSEREGTNYRFESLWRLEVPVGRVYAALADVERYDVWWPQVRSIERIDDESGRVAIRSFLPYTLRLVLRRAVEDPDRGHLRVQVRGDLHGWCAWQLAGSADGTEARFTQEVQVRAPALQRFSVLNRPLLRANHAFMMAAGRRGLSAHLGRSQGV